MSALQVTWFIILALLLVAFAATSGFDLGIGIMHLVSRDKRERDTNFSAVGPFWDGNEVWLLAVGGGLFAVFPMVYAAVFSGMYLALMLLLFALIARAVSIEFGPRATSTRTRALGDAAFGLSSIVAVLLLGVALGNLLRGMLLDAKGNYAGSFIDLLHPFALLVGLVNLAMLAMYGQLYLAMKSDGEIAAQARRRARYAFGLYLPLAVVIIAFAAITKPHLAHNYLTIPVLWIVPALAITAIIAAGWLNARGKSGPAFIASSASIIGLLTTAAIALFPTLVPALGHPAYSLTITNASSSPNNLRAVLWVAIIGISIVTGYTIWFYRMFRGKLSEGTHY